MVHLQVNFSGDDKYPGVSGVFTREIHLTRWVPRAPPAPPFACVSVPDADAPVPHRFTDARRQQAIYCLLCA